MGKKSHRMIEAGRVRSVVESVERSREKIPALQEVEAPWQGQLVLVCEKCERRLRKDRKNRDLPRLRKVLKACAEESDQPIALRVLEVGCMKLCPEGGVTVCTGAQMAERPVQLSVVSTAEDVVRLYEGLVRSASAAAAEQDPALVEL